MNFTIYLSYYVIIIASIIGYGLFFFRIFKNTIDIEFEYNLLGSLLFLISLSFFTHFFFSHGYIHNVIILLIGIILFLFNFPKEKNKIKKYIQYISIIFGILIVALLTHKTHDDFPYYHFPYTYYLTQENLVVGAGQLVHAFRTPSSIFYLNSLFYLPIVEYFLFNMGAILILGFSNLILIFKLKNDFQSKKYDFIFFLTLLSFLFINIFFYRIAEHGTDRSAQILIFILFIEAFNLYRMPINTEKIFTKIFILLGLIITLKAFYVLYLLILIPTLLEIKKSKLFLNFLKNFYFYIFCFVGLFLMLINIFNSGCILYPVSITCFTNLDWSLFYEAKSSNDWYEQWAKAGAGPNHRVTDPENYIKGFNWVSNWMEMYFFNKVSDFILGLVFLLLVVLFIFYSKKKSYKKIKKQNYYIYLISLILLFEWFYNHPSLRYGGYSLVALIMFMPFSLYISQFISIRFLKEKIIFLIVLSLIIFVGRNVNRINYEIQKYDYKVFSYPFYYLDQVHFRVDKYFNSMLVNYQNCVKNNETNCESLKGLSLSKKNIYYILKRDK
tara:strand:- start:284 stop:1948 length:1665 start_codon:yes stop_codon:yes gene_type:complete